MAKAPRPGTKRKTDEIAASDFTLKVYFDDSLYEISPMDISALDSLELRKQTGSGIAELTLRVMEHADISDYAAVIWLARRAAGEALTFAEVARSVTLASLDEARNAASEHMEDEAPGEA